MNLSFLLFLSLKKGVENMRSVDIKPTDGTVKSANTNHLQIKRIA